MTPIELLVARLAENGILHSFDILEANELFRELVEDAWDDGKFETSGSLDSMYYFNQTFNK